jgi:hypothetical protein
MILFRLEKKKKTGVPLSLFTTGHKFTFNRILRRIVVNTNLVRRKAVKF